MTRPPGASFAQFFPTAPKVKAQAQSRADRERPKSSINGIEPDSSPGPVSVLHSDANALTRSVPGQNGTQADVAQTHIDDNESPSADIPSTVGSSSSHSTTSSVFSTSARQAGTAATSRLPTSSLTPIASKDSPSYSSNTTFAKSDMSSSLITDQASGQPSRNSLATDHNGSISNGLSAIERIPARDPMPSVKGKKCTYDPLLDRVHNKNVSRNAKPTYKDFGLVRVNIYIPSGGASSMV